MRLTDIWNSKKDQIDEQFQMWLESKNYLQLKSLSALDFAEFCNVDEEVAIERFDNYLIKGDLQAILTAKCPECRSECAFDYSRRDKLIFCDDCGFIFKASERDLKDIIYYSNKPISLENHPDDSNIIKLSFEKENEYLPIIACEGEDMSSSHDHTNEAHRDYDLVIGIVAALEKELKPIVNLLTDKRLECIGSHIYNCGYFIQDNKKVKIIAAHALQMGMVPMTVLCVELINKFKPDYLTMTGIAASIDRNAHNYGDILVPDIIWDYGSGKIVEDANNKAFLSEQTQIPLDGELKSKLRLFKNDITTLREIKDEFNKNNTTPSTELTIHIGPMASGSAVVASEKFIKDYVEHQQRKLMGIDMELYGLFYAASNNCFHKPKCFAMKSVVDYADNMKSDNHHSYAVFTSARALYRFIFKHLL